MRSTVGTSLGKMLAITKSVMAKVKVLGMCVFSYDSTKVTAI